MFDRAQLTYLLVDGYHLLAELLEAMKLGNLLLGFAKRRWIREGFGHGSARHSSGQAELRIVTRIVGFGAMAGWLSTAMGHRRNRTGPEVTQMEELFQELGSISFQGGESIRQVGVCSVCMHTHRIMPQQTKIAKVPFLCRAPGVFCMARF